MSIRLESERSKSNTVMSNESAFPSLTEQMSLCTMMATTSSVISEYFYFGHTSTGWKLSVPAKLKCLPPEISIADCQATRSPIGRMAYDRFLFGLLLEIHTWISTHCHRRVNLRVEERRYSRITRTYLQKAYSASMENIPNVDLSPGEARESRHYHPRRSMQGLRIVYTL